MEYKEGQLLRFTPFKFKNGATPKKKYFIVLKHMNNCLMMASLPTSKNHIPTSIPLSSGCINIPERAVNAFIFLPEKKVTDSFNFPLPTFVYGEQIDEYYKVYLDEMETDIEDFGIIHDDIFKMLKDCLKQSVLLKKKYRNLL